MASPKRLAGGGAIALGSVFLGWQVRRLGKHVLGGGRLRLALAQVPRAGAAHLTIRRVSVMAPINIQRTFLANS